jgi:hypothetical protein
MTDEEALKLQPGDKIVFIGEDPVCQQNEDLELSSFAIKCILSHQEKNEGYLVVEKSPEFLDFGETKVVAIRTDGGLRVPYLLCFEVELYEPNRPWSYERDY